VAAGTYCVRQTVDSISAIDELSENNNVTETRIFMDPAALRVGVLEQPCRGSDPLTGDPETDLLRAPPQRLKTKHHQARVRFEFTGSDAGALECSLDGARFVPCSSGDVVRLRAHRHRWTPHEFEMRAVDGAGNVDASPADWSGQVKRRVKRGGRG
jgi:hypothetical protein